MDIEITERTSCLTPSFEAARNQFSRLSREATQLHESIQIHDDRSRAVFSALSRLMAMSDQIELVLTLMREDVRVIDELSAGSADGLWSEPSDDSFQQWLWAPRSSSFKIN